MSPPEKPAKPARLPGLSYHKATKQYYVRIKRRPYYLGADEARAEKERLRLLAEWRGTGRLPGKGGAPPPGGPLLSELYLDYCTRHVAGHYRLPDGTPTSEQRLIRQACRPLLRLYGHTRAGEFGPKALKAVREEMVARGCGKAPREGGPPMARKVVNQHVRRITRLFEWAVSEELVPETVHRALLTVAPLEPGRSAARETDEVTPPPPGAVEAALPHAPPQVAAMVRVQVLTGARPGEVCRMRPQDLDRTGVEVSRLLRWPVTTGRVWAYLPGLERHGAALRQQHKTSHHGLSRVVPVGPRAQEVLAPFLEGRAPDAPVFSPAEALAWSLAGRRARRKSKVPPSQKDRSRPNPRKKAGARFGVNAYARAINRACTLAVAAAIAGGKAAVVVRGHRLGRASDAPVLKALEAARGRGVAVEHDPAHPEAQVLVDGAPCPAAFFHPHQLRHLAATNLEREFGEEVARIVCGHTTVATTRRYIVRNVEKGFKAIEQAG